MKRLFPDSLVGRTLLVLVLGLLLSQLAGMLIFEANRSRLVDRMSGRQVAERIAGAVKTFSASAEMDRLKLLRVMDSEGLRVGWGTEPVVSQTDFEGPASEIRGEIQALIPGHEVFVSVRMPPPPPPVGEPDHGPGLRHPGPVARIALQLDDGNWLNFIAPMHRGEPFWRPGLFGPLSGGLLVVLALSIMAVRRAAKPLMQMAAAAERLGRDVAAPPMPVSGPREVRAAAQAFNEMQTRLRRFVDDRTQMVAAISHDLRTPITRLKLRAEFIDDDEVRAKTLADLDEMEAMIASTLSFARDDAAREERKQFDLAAMLAEVCGETGAVYDGPDTLMVQGGPVALKRAFCNLLENARKYAGEATLSLSADEKAVHVELRDHGPGIPESELERVFAPFHRVETSRNRETGGTGLGLSVARSALRSHGGDVRLRNHPDGGLVALVTLPR